jgi:hypothetical protein
MLEDSSLILIIETLVDQKMILGDREWEKLLKKPILIENMMNG